MDIDPPASGTENLKSQSEPLAQETLASNLAEISLRHKQNMHIIEKSTCVFASPICTYNVAKHLTCIEKKLRYPCNRMNRLTEWCQLSNLLRRVPMSKS